MLAWLVTSSDTVEQRPPASQCARDLLELCRATCTKDHVGAGGREHLCEMGPQPARCARHQRDSTGQLPGAQGCRSLSHSTVLKRWDTVWNTYPRPCLEAAATGFVTNLAVVGRAPYQCKTGRSSRNGPLRADSRYAVAGGYRPGPSGSMQCQRCGDDRADLFRRFATRCDCRTMPSTGIVHLACATIWPRRMSIRPKFRHTSYIPIRVPNFPSPDIPRADRSRLSHAWQSRT